MTSCESQLPVYNGTVTWILHITVS